MPMMSYYHLVRREIEPLLPPDIKRVLDVGCGAGGTLRWIKDVAPGAETVGLELNPAVKDDLERNADVAVIGSIDDRLPEIGRFDLILLLDVLEHLPDPAATLRRLTSILRPEGSVIVSVPNIAHYSVILPLVLRRRFTYRDAGIMDRTHLRFFVEDTAVGLLGSAGLVVDKGLVSGLQGPRARLANRLTLGLMKHYLVKQYIMRGRLATQDGGSRFEWGTAG